jgi:hypothetical protein
MPGLDPGIHVAAKKGVDGRVKPGHDEGRQLVSSMTRML